MHRQPPNGERLPRSKKPDQVVHEPAALKRQKTPPLESLQPPL